MPRGPRPLPSTPWATGRPTWPRTGSGGTLVTQWDHDRAVNNANEITGLTQRTGAWASPAYDARGNMTTVPKPTALTSAYTCTYDAWNRLVEVKSGETIVARYEYDGLGRRIKAHIDAQAPDSPNGVDHYRHFYYNASWQILETRKSTSENTGPETLDTEMQYVWSARYIDSPVLRDRDADSNAATGDYGGDGNEENGVTGLEERLYYTTDANQNVTALVESDGDVVERYVYDPYGQVTFYTANGQKTQVGQETPGTLSAYSNAILFAGYYRDSETGLYHVRNRMYHVQLGWLTRDPLGYVDGMSLYEYVNGLPTGRADPWGKEANKNEADRYEGFWGKLRYAWDIFWTAVKGAGAPIDAEAAGHAGFGIIDINNSELRIKLEKDITSKGKDPRGNLEWCLRVYATKGAQALGAIERKTLRDAGYEYDPKTGTLKRISDQNPPGEKGPRGSDGETGATTTKKKPDETGAGGEVTPGVTVEPRAGPANPPALWEEEGAKREKWTWWSSDGKQPDPVSVIVQGMKGMGGGGKYCSYWQVDYGKIMVRE